MTVDVHRSRLPELHLKPHFAAAVFAERLLRLALSPSRWLFRGISASSIVPRLLFSVACFHWVGRVVLFSSGVYSQVPVRHAWNAESRMKEIVPCF